MLAAMTGITAITLTAHKVTPPFIGLFYATAATIIPVLFLAIAVQTRFFGTCSPSISRTPAESDKARNSVSQRSRRSPLAMPSAHPFGSQVAILLYGTVSETDGGRWHA
jgi:hypothetical protein